MRELRKLNTEESISKQRLVFDEGWLDKFNRLAVYVVFSPLIFLPIVVFLNEKFDSPNDEFILHWVLPTSLIFGLYIFYRNATEKKLIVIVAELDRQTIKKLLLEYANQNEFEVYRKSDNCIILNEAYSDWSSAYKKTRIFFFKDNQLLFTVIRDGFRLNLPTLFSHIFLKRDLNKLIKKAST